ncbi:hypothetical protein BKA64DRAFT_754804 [Cadophora sp. MPI-SDFR-AT-0126]|nr:hypothetical protein BKA64DRAFT_754804 [Leotiomycetes sp. MPI-SDFR-AT-0126]
MTTMEEEWAEFSGLGMQGDSIFGQFCPVTSEQTHLLATHPSFHYSPPNELFHEPVFHRIQTCACAFQYHSLHACHCLGMNLTDMVSNQNIDAYDDLHLNSMASPREISATSQTYISFDRDPDSFTPSLSHEVDTLDNTHNSRSIFNFTNVPKDLQDFGTYDLETPQSSLWSQDSLSTLGSSLSASPAQQPSDSIATTNGASSVSSITCSWQGCDKVFSTKVDLNHHLRYHIKRFQCPHCSLKQATKRLLDRHINERHSLTEKYYCSFEGCPRSIGGASGNGARHFTREDNCKRHMRKIHGQMPGTDGGLVGGTHKMGAVKVTCAVVDMDESTRQIKRNRRTRGAKLEVM